MNKTSIDVVVWKPLSAREARRVSMEDEWRGMSIPALNCLTLTVRQELAADNIRAGLVYPRRTATAFHEHLANGAWQDSGARTAGERPADSADDVAEKILEAVQTEEAEVFW